MLPFVPPGESNGSAQDEGPHGVRERWGNGGENDANLMSDGKVVLVVLDVADVLLFGLKEDGCGSEVVRRGSRLTMKLRGKRSSPRI